MKLSTLQKIGEGTLLFGIPAVLSAAGAITSYFVVTKRLKNNMEIMLNAIKESGDSCADYNETVSEVVQELEDNVCDLIESVSDIKKEHKKAFKDLDTLASMASDHADAVDEDLEGVKKEFYDHLAYGGHVSAVACTEHLKPFPAQNPSANNDGDGEKTCHECGHCGHEENVNKEENNDRN